MRRSERLNKGKLPSHLAEFEVVISENESTMSEQGDSAISPNEGDAVNHNNSADQDPQEPHLASDASSPKNPQVNSSSTDEQLQQMMRRMDSILQLAEGYRLEAMEERNKRKEAERILRLAEQELTSALEPPPPYSSSSSSATTSHQSSLNTPLSLSRVFAKPNGIPVQQVTAVNVPLTTTTTCVLGQISSDAIISETCLIPRTSIGVPNPISSTSNVMSSSTQQGTLQLNNLPQSSTAAANSVFTSLSHQQQYTGQPTAVPNATNTQLYSAIQQQQSAEQPSAVSNATNQPQYSAIQQQQFAGLYTPREQQQPQQPPSSSMFWSAPHLPQIPSRMAPVPPPAPMFSRHTLMELPTFSGKPEEWPAFHTTYRQSTMSFGYTTLDNLYRLQRSLTGAARQAVEPLLIHHENVERAIASLAFRFGRPELLARSQLDKVRIIRPISDHQIEQIVPFASTVENLVAFLQNGQCEYELINPSLLADLVSKLPMFKRLEWTQHSAHMVPRATIVEFSQWLNLTAQYVTLAYVDIPSNHSQPRHQFPPQQRHQNKGKNDALFHVAEQSSPVLCSFCSRPHKTSDCFQLRDLTTDRRWDEVKRLRLCFSCLTSGHDSSSCQSKRRCDVNNCHHTHHPLLHEVHREQAENITRGKKPFRLASRSTHQPAASQVGASDASRVAQRRENSAQNHNQPYTNPFATQPSTQPKKNNNTTAVVNHCHEMTHRSPLLFRILPVVLYGRAKTVNTYAMIDEGAAVSLIDTDLANELGLVGPPTQLNLQWFGNISSSVQSNIVAFEISGTNDHRRFQMDNVKTVPSLSLPTQTVRLSDIHSSQRHIKGLPIQEYDGAKPRLLIGLDFSHLAAPIKTIRGNATGPTIVKTELGWIIYGRQSPILENAATHLLHARSIPEITVDEKLERIVSDYFTTENFGVKQPDREMESTTDARARRMLDQSTMRVGDRFQTSLLWSCDDVVLPNSYSMALRRLITVERKMHRDPKYAALYCKNINDYVRKGYARRLTETEAAKTGPRTWYLPHFGVVNPHKPEKLRMVFDAAACVDGVSLNSVLLSGPDLNPALPGILFKFRIGEVAVCGDICEMFHQIIIRPEDRDSQRFLWRQGDSTRRPDIYEMVVMTFGATCSPAAAQFTKNRNADENSSEFPNAVEPIKSLHYVDDFVASFSTTDEAAEVTKAVTEVHRRGGFVLRNFVSNQTAVLHAIGAPSANSSTISLQPKSPTAADRILGMSWDTLEDAFMFQPTFAHLQEDVINGLKPPTKRQVLSVAMSVFDPFGLLADYMLHAKLIVQDLWRVGSGWDEPIPTALQERWTSWFTQMNTLRECRIPRCYSPKLQSSSNVQLHVFADASQSAFAAVAYFRVQHNDGIDVAFIVGKTKCAPLKLLSIPRLELQAAVLAARLTSTIREHHQINISRTVLWSDSKTVLQWIRSDHRRYKPFVAHRIAEVLEVTSEVDWRWVPTSFNVADDATRSKAKPQFNPKSRWLFGPEFLKKPESEWPVEPHNVGESNAADEEMRQQFVGLAVEKVKLIDHNRFSTYSRLRRTMAWVLRFASNSSTRRLQTPRTTGELMVKELDKSELHLCRQAQAAVYVEECAALHKNESINPSSSIKSLMPYLDETGTMRIYGRTDAALDMYLPANAKRPILLPKDHHITRLIILDYHHRMRHQNDDAVACAIRAKFWVPHLRAAVRRSRQECLICKLRTARPKPPVMGQLPVDRLTPYVRPFTYTGLDFFGPLSVTVGRRQEKRWAALFTCLTVRAVHIELASDLSADACLLCVRNFANIRGVPLRIRSDNGTNFIAASKVVRDSPDFFDEVKMRRELAIMGIEWVFNSPGHPEAGGCWERLVQCIKRIIVVTLNERAPRVETLRSYLMEAANIVNSRPLTHVPVSPNDESPITPNHFLISETSSTTVPCPIDEKMWCLRKQWRIAQQLSSSFWSKWVKMYLPDLTRRTKWYKEQPTIRVGDLVLVCDSNQSRNEWRRGRIAKIYPGPDGRVRNAEVKTQDGLLRRPVSKLALLDIKDEPQMGSVHGGGDVAS